MSTHSESLRIAQEHCKWAWFAGYTPRAVIESVINRPTKSAFQFTWDDALAVVLAWADEMGATGMRRAA
ncbi:hypothetical protein TSH7_01420 [Azospirillum sp. TSH7]|uniref:hypothetical protein n=1 Tax=unclassified Azospirillum TaxID=2630922 RepID=UPI000D618F97|nr:MULTISPECIES: hypothetical protein [unclassified Azospirillum]PWC69131.1 hypothetical protein TSH7_01420 [Azospirillum sp. TSH7]PWC71377.1 hypothetical protein TSH20_03655 [Azospirillum sp. TSH20]